MTHPLLKPPGGVFVLAGLAHALAYVVDYGLTIFGPEVSGVFVGAGPIHQASDLVRYLAPGAGLIIAGVIIFYLARISARLTALAEVREGSR